jgi:hypothetical protein
MPKFALQPTMEKKMIYPGEDEIAKEDNDKKAQC